jgi:hypothetical protein
VPNPDGCRKIIGERQEEADADEEAVCHIREAMRRLEDDFNSGHYGERKRNYGDPDTDFEREIIHVSFKTGVYFWTSSAVSRLIEVATNEKIGSGAASSTLKCAGISEFKYTPRGTGRGWTWRGKDSAPGGKVLHVIDFHPDDRCWRILKPRDAFNRKANPQVTPEVPE